MLTLAQKRVITLVSSGTTQVANTLALPDLRKRTLDFHIREGRFQSCDRDEVFEYAANK
jgi:hypothetical protein